MLLEVLVAVALLGATGLALTGIVSAGLRSEAHSREREQTLATQERVLTALALLGRDDLDRRLGRHPVGAFVADIERPEPMLYRLALVDTLALEAEALVTVVFRPEAKHAP